jgi:predicted transcriptional regulator
MITISDGTRTVVISNEDVRVAETNCLDFFEWVVNATQEKCRRVLDRLVLEHTNLNPTKLEKAEKMASIAAVPLKSVREKNAEVEAKMQ